MKQAPNIDDSIGVFVIVGCLVGIMIACSIQRILYNRSKRIYIKRSIRIDESIKILKEKKEEKKKIIKENANEKYSKYCQEFEREASEKSVQFAESDLANEVIDWMTKGFCKTIDSADRRSHIEKLCIPFVFNIFTNKITCNLGTYDFQIKRCRNLTGPIEQTALARAIANEIQVKIMGEYPQDVSGTDISVEIAYVYFNDHPQVTITYVALNRNYKTVKEW